MHDPVHMREMLVTEYKTADGRQVRITERVVAFHRAEQRMTWNDFSGMRRLREAVFAWTLPYFFRYEIEHLLARCGFRVMALVWEFRPGADPDDSPEMIFVAEDRQGNGG